MGFWKAILFVLIAFALGAMVTAALPFLYLIGMGIVVLGVAYLVLFLKDFDPEKHNPFE